LALVRRLGQNVRAMSLHAWLDLALRWAHLVAGIAWIGSSFYFIWLDRHLEKPPSGGSDTDLAGSLWMVHSGGFYRVERRRVGPGRMPRVLHWFKWEAAVTWITGFALLGLVYYSTRGLYLVDADSPLSPSAASGVGLAVLAVGWLVYDLLWRGLGERAPRLALAVSLALLGGLALGLPSVFSGRGAYLHLGSMLGTLMAANVWLRILPAQTAMIRATEAGREPDFSEGERAKRRSVHNTYLTLPVLFTMLSGHFPGTYESRAPGLVLLLFVLLGMVARHLLIGEARERRRWAAPAAACAAGLVLLSGPRGSGRPAEPPAAALRAALAGEGSAPAFAEVEAVIVARCVACHATAPRLALYGAAPGGVNFEKPGEIERWARRIAERAVKTHDMPLGNMTAMTDEERLLLARWVGHGAPRP
jgi:uncharacterized membrane protein